MGRLCTSNDLLRRRVKAREVKRFRLSRGLYEVLGARNYICLENSIEYEPHQLIELKFLPGAIDPKHRSHPAAYLNPKELPLQLDSEP